MIFGPVPISEAEGAILAHAARLADGRISKGTVLSAEDVARLADAGVTSVIVARLQPGDLQEDEAAEALAKAIVGDYLRLTPATTGRVNIHATENGMFVADKALIDRFNRIDPALTLACLADHVAVMKGDMVATLKIIPLAVSGEKVDAARRILADACPFAVKPFVPHDVTLVATELASLKPSVMDKTARLLEQRLAPSGSRLRREIRVGHDAEAVGRAIGEALAEPSDAPRMVVVFGASAVCDPEDVIPSAIRLAGGDVTQVGLPVDPGNLLVLGAVGDVPVIGAPGCARSPKENGFDWVLTRILAGEVPDSDALTGLGVGGLLMEIPTRPMPRAKVSDGQGGLRTAVVLLAAGKASRMGESGRHKLLAEFEGVPLVRRMAERALDACEGPVILVTGYRSAEILNAVDGLPVETCENPDYASGMASSIRSGLASLGKRDMDGVMIMLADMPGVSVTDLEALFAAFRRMGGRAIVRAVADGKRGNPVILPRSTFAAIMKLEGDIGARAIVETSGLDVVDVEIGSAAHLDVDTPEAVLAAGGVLKS